MKLNRHIAVVGMFLVTALFTITLPSHAQDVTPDEARQIAKDAYVYGYPLITMEMTRRVMTKCQCTGRHAGTHGALGPDARLSDRSL